jgi:hypothetical protein
MSGSGRRDRVAGAPFTDRIEEPLGGRGKGVVCYSITVIRYADGGRVVLELGDTDDLRALFERAIGRCDQYRWLVDPE